MPMLPVSLPSVWNIPVAVGVPALMGQSVSAGVQASASVTVGSVLDDLQITQAASQWGIFTQDGQRVLTSAHVLSADMQSAWRIAEAPLEDGAFLSYSKVRMSRQHRIVMVCDGSEAGTEDANATSLALDVLAGAGQAGALYVRAGFFATLEALEADTNLYAVMTPEKKYDSVNIIGHRWMRQARQGITMPVVEIALQEVRITGSTQFTSTRMPQGQQIQCGGMAYATTSSIDAGEIA
ncbi:phage baseplate protein [Acetobacter ascendens]|uniref:Uncharacterized protein n=1 Tax=Acetobacter ascendens TaxID=481146 RepID=A0A1D8QT72_9PROT|nr:hypothetical protein [Acetobacter ascendens]AOW45530.1 hypothetical protein A4S02_00755 [Acetobacter ascendens]AOW48204.1 hypothetical protein A4R89_00875 [Acetobacter ascendens]